MTREVADNARDFEFGMPEDDHLCRWHRLKVEMRGFKFAPTHVAASFSYERVRPFDTDGHPIKTFGFHGPFNWPDVLTDEQIRERVAAAPAWFFQHVHYQQMVQELRGRGRAHALTGFSNLHYA